ncbi:MAG: FHA domain-containing protein [Steroidobacteraceae bacterium]
MSPAVTPAEAPAAASGQQRQLEQTTAFGETGEHSAVTGSHAAATGSHALATGSHPAANDTPAAAEAPRKQSRRAARPAAAEPAAAAVDHAATTGTRAVLRARQEVAAAAEAHADSTQDHVEHSGIRPADVPPQVPEGPPLAHVLIAHGARTLFERALYPGRLLIGRTPNNDVQIDSKFISRHHCQILTTPTGCTIEDLNSRNGVFIKSKRVRLHHLNDGDVVTIGQHEILYIDERPSRHSG